jgi:mannonate dehydratase
MRQTWRWFGPIDRVSIADARQAGAEGIVTALHHIPYGAVWSPEEIAARQREVATMPDGSPSGLAWEVVESLPVSEAIKTQTGDWRRHIDNYRISMRNLAAAGIEVLCYNFMPVLDWTRTDLAYKVAHGGTTMRFDLVDFAVFDLHVLARPAAVEEWSKEIREEAAARFAKMDAATIDRLSHNIGAGLPGATETWSIEQLRRELATYDHIDAGKLRQNFVDFLAEVIPTAEEVGMRLCCHPDDPPFPLLGLPRIMSTEADYVRIVEAVDSPANGITLCCGSLGSRADNDLPGMMERLGPKVHFVHLRNVCLETSGTPCSFHEDEHLGGHTDMVHVIAAVLREEARRRAEGRRDCDIPMRPDHGQDILDDLRRGAQPGYPAIGRLKGLAELRGITRALEAVASGDPGARVG